MITGDSRGLSEVLADERHRAEGLAQECAYWKAEAERWHQAWLQVWGSAHE